MVPHTNQFAKQPQITTYHFTFKQENCVSDNGNFTENCEFSALSYEIFVSHMSTPSTEANVSPTWVLLALGSVSNA